jgi:PTS system glucitol/sorbitol-specific IIA component
VSEPIYLTEVTELGPEVAEFMEAGLLILFQAGAPPELAEIAVLHEPISRREDPPEPGDVLAIGPQEFRITAVGSKAWQNIQDLGHAVFRFSGSVEAELPGEIHLEERGAEDLAGTVRPGVRVEIKPGGA